MSLVASLAVLVGASALAPASAAVLTGASSAFGESVGLTTVSGLGLATVNASSGPLPTAAGAAPAPYNLTNTAASAFVLNVLTTGLLSATASSTIDALPGARAAFASSTVNDLAIGVLRVLGLNASQVVATASLSGAPGAITAAGTTTITNLTLNGILQATAAILPNTVLLDAAGVRVVLNEQILAGAGNTQSLSVNAIHVTFNNASQSILGDILNRVNSISGSIVIGHAEASINAVADPAPVPEPASLALLGLGLAGIAAARRRA